MKSIRLIAIVIAILTCRTVVICQDTRTGYFYECNHTFHYKREIDSEGILLVDTVNTTIIRAINLKNERVLLIIENLFPTLDWYPSTDTIPPHKSLLILDKNGKRIYKVEEYKISNENKFAISREKILKGDYVLLDSIYDFQNGREGTFFNGKEIDYDKVYFMPYVDYMPTTVIDEADNTNGIFLAAKFPQLIARDKKLKTFRRADRHEGGTYIIVDNRLCLRQFSYQPNLGVINEYKFTLINDCCK